MEPSSEVLSLLNQIHQPLFLVKDEKISHLNHAAQMRQLCVGTPIFSLIAIGETEYRYFTSGKLLLNLKIDETVYNASVIKNGEYDLFCIESTYDSPELQALALAAQNLRNPLSGALLSTESLMRKASEPEDPALIEEIGKLNKHLYQLYRIIGNMSDAAQFEQRSCIRAENRDVGGFIHEIIKKAASLTDACGYKFVFEELKTPVFAPIFAEKLERALLNLISNAIKYGPEKSTIKISLQQGLNQLYLSVQNTQKPTNDNLSKNLFLRFLREPGLENDNSGIGLGLTIVRGAAIAHDGTVLIEQPDEEGLKFTMTLSLTRNGGSQLHSPIQIHVDYGGGYDRTLVELSDILPPEAYQ